MKKEKLIPAIDFCENHHVEISFVNSLEEAGLLEITTVEEVAYIDPDQMESLERIVRLYFDLDINLEGIETIQYLLKRMMMMQEEITALRNRLRLYE